MPNRPQISRLNASAADILNAIRNGATADYQNRVPIADASDIASIRAIGNIIMEFPALQNEFLNALVNRIGRVIVTSKMYSNPWNMFKKGTLEFGETIEEVFVELAKGFQYDPAAAESNVFKREIPDVRAAFHILNYQKFYKSTIQREQLRQAFLSWEGITDLISKIVNAMYTSANYDEFNVMKYMLAKHILNGDLKAITVQTVNAANAKANVSTIKGVSNSFEFMATGYNKAGVHNFSVKDDQYLILNSDFDSVTSVEVLASAFNMDKADFDGHRVLVDSFGTIDFDRLGDLFENDPNFDEFTDAEILALKSVPAVLVDRDWFMIIDNLIEFTEQYNGEGLYWNYWLHLWKTFSVSPFANAAVFVPGTPTVSSVTVSPSAVTASPGQIVKLSAVVATTNFAPQTVVWTSDDDDVTVDIYGVVTIGEDATGTEGVVTITATSKFDSTKSDTCEITLDLE